MHSTSSFAQSIRNSRLSAVAVVVLLGATAVAAPVVLTPAAGDTFVDGCVFGPFDGYADSTDNTDAGPRYAGAITRTPTTQLHPLEHRVILRYDIGALQSHGIAQAQLAVRLKGSTVEGGPSANVHVYAFTGDGPSESLELADFAAAASLHGELDVPALTPAADYFVDVSSAVDQALRAGNREIAFRLQIDPDATGGPYHALLLSPSWDDLATPQLLVSAFAAGDCDQDGDVDLNDLADLATCLQGPGVPTPTGCACFDLNASGAIDLVDFALWQTAFTG